MPVQAHGLAAVRVRRGQDEGRVGEDVVGAGGAGEGEQQHGHGQAGVEQAADLHLIDITRAIGVNRLGKTAIDGTPAWRNTLLSPQAQAATQVAGREDRRELGLKQARKEADRIAEDIKAGTAPARQGLAASAIGTLVRMAETDPQARLQLMNHHRNEIRWAAGGRPWPLRLLAGLLGLVSWPFLGKTRVEARHRAKIIHDWRDHHTMSKAMRYAHTTPVTVIWGAGHMKAQSNFLHRNGFTQTHVSWLRVMSVANPSGTERKRVIARMAETTDQRAADTDRRAAELAEQNSLVVDTHRVGNRSTGQVSPDSVIPTAVAAPAGNTHTAATTDTPPTGQEGVHTGPSTMAGRAPPVPTAEYRDLSTMSTRPPRPRGRRPR